MSPSVEAGAATWIELSASAYASNLALFRRLLGPRIELAVVVKANAYGHGLTEIAALAAAHGADSFCVHSMEEALALRRSGFHQDVLVMGHVPLVRLAEAVDEGFRLVLYNQLSVAALGRLSTSRQESCRLHLKLETGTHRQGVEGDQLVALIEELKRHPNLRLEGIYSHFATAEETSRPSITEGQMRCFEEQLEQLRQAGFGNMHTHLACSAAVLLAPRSHHRMVRLGIGQYGLWPSPQTYRSFLAAHPEEGEQALRPVLCWKTRVSQVKEVLRGAHVSYGWTYQVTRRSRLAVLPIGYSDGFDRGLSNQGWVLIRGRRAAVRGRICMNLTMVDVTDIPGVEVEDEVVLIGRQGEREITAWDQAVLLGTIAYEVVARIRAGIPRWVTDC